MREIWGAALIVSGLMLDVPALAQEQPELEWSGIYMLDGDRSDIGIERTANVGDALMSAEIRFEQTALISQPTIAVIHGFEIALDGQTFLRLASPSAPEFYDLPSGSKTYCTGRMEMSNYQRYTYPPGDVRRGNRIELFAREIRLCFVDDTADGSFNSGFIHGAVSPDIQRTSQIDPIAYSVASLDDEQGFRLEVRYMSETAFMERDVWLEVHTNIHRDIFLPSYINYWDEDGRRYSMRRRRNFSPGSLPRETEHQHGQITILSFDPETRAIRYRIDEVIGGARIQVQAVSLNYPNTTTYIYE